MVEAEDVVGVEAEAEAEPEDVETEEEEADSIITTATMAATIPITPNRSGHSDSVMNPHT